MLKIVINRVEGEFSYWGIRRSILMLFLFYMNVSGMRLWSCLSSQPLMILAPWVLLYIWWSFPLVPPWVTASHFLVWNKEAELKPSLSLHFYFSMISCLSSSPHPSVIYCNTFDRCLVGLVFNDNFINWLE